MNTSANTTIMNLFNHHKGNIMKPCKFLTASMAICLFAVAPVSASTLVLPIAGEGDNQFNTPLQSGARTLQFVYHSSLLASIPSGSDINGMAFRLNGGVATWPASTRTWTNYDIYLSTSVNAPGSLSLTFADNIGPDVVNVRSGSLTVGAGDYSGGETPNDFGPTIVFSTPFTYTGGNLLFTIRHTGNGVESQLADANSNDPGLYETVFNFTSGYSAVTADAVLPATPIIQLSYTAIPEPSAAAMLLGGCACLFRRRRPKSDL
jgi:hypothetical protein